MQAGLLAKYQLIRYHLSASAVSELSGFAGKSATGLASIEQIIATSPSSSSLFLAIRFSHSRTRSLGLSEKIRIILGTIYDQEFQATSGAIEFEDCKLHFIKGSPPYFRFHAEEARIYAGGQLRQTLSNFNALAYYIAPTGVPGLAPSIFSASATAAVPGAPHISPGGGSGGGGGQGIQTITIDYAEISLSASAGLSLDGGFPISIEILPAPSYSCPVPAYSFPTISGNGSDDISASVAAREEIENHGYGGGGQFILLKQETKWQDCKIWLAPHIPSSWIPLSSDSQSLADRYAIPSASKHSLAIVYYYNDDGQSSEECSESPESSELVAHEQAAGPIRLAGEKQFDALPCPYLIESYYFYGEQSDVEGRLFIKQSFISSKFPILSIPTGMIGYLAHNDPYLRYWNLCLHPHWSHFLRFADWPAGDPLGAIPAGSYWRPMRIQWLGEGALPMEDRTKRRLHPMLEPFNESSLADWLADEYELPAPTWWIGVSRFKVLEWAPAGQIALTADSEPRWEFEGAIATFLPSGILITPSALSCRARFRLADDESPPYLYPQLADAVRIVAGVPFSVWARNAEGEMRQCDLIAEGWYDLATRAEDAFYAGTWEMNSLWPGDRGFDLLPSGRSLATSQDRFRRTALQLLFSSTGRQISIEFSLEDLTPFLLPYPIFRWDASQSITIPLTANTSAILRSRNGIQYLAYDPLQRITREPSWAPSLLEWLALKRILPLGEAPDGEEMWAEAAEIYDAAELLPNDAPLGERLADLRADTRSVPAPLRERDGEPLFIIISAPAELPPLVMAPTKRRNPQTLQPQSDLGNFAYYLSPARRYYANPAKPAEIWKDDSGERQMLSSLLGAHGIWRISYLDLATNGDEVVRLNSGEIKPNPKWLIAAGDIDYGRISPFWGFWCSLVPPPGAPGVLLIDSRHGWIHYSKDTHLISRYQYSFTQFIDHDAGEAIHSLALDTRRGLLYIATHNSAHRIYRSSDAGATLEEVLMFPAESSCIVAASEIGRLILLYFDEGAKMRYSNDGGGTWSQPVSIQLNGAAMADKPLSADWDPRARLILMLYEISPGNYGLARSTDYGASFADIL